MSYAADGTCYDVTGLIGGSVFAETGTFVGSCAGVGCAQRQRPVRRGGKTLLPVSSAAERMT